jgi:hypothetical protein
MKINKGAKVKSLVVNYYNEQIYDVGSDIR